MSLYIAAYKHRGRLTDRFVRFVLSIRHGRPVKYSHVELLPAIPVRSGRDRVGRSLAASKRDNREVRLKDPLVFKEGHWDFFELPVSEEEANRIWAVCKAQIGCPYDTLGAALCVTPFARLHPIKKWCSGKIAWAAWWDNPETYDPQMVVDQCRKVDL